MNCKKGFTLIELLIVVAIIGILAAIAVPNFLNAQMRAKIAKVESEFRTISTAFEMYRMDNGNALPRWSGMGWARAWASFTTPISYMSLRPIDIFQPEYDELFVNNHQWYEFSAAVGDVSYHSKEGAVTDYVVASLGPDNDDDTHGIGNYPNSSKFVSYDPTNGLISDGDVLKQSNPTLQQERL